MEPAHPEPTRVRDPNLENRRSPRVTLLQEVVCERGEVKARSEFSEICVGGMFIDMPRPPFAPGEQVTVSTTLQPSEPGLVAGADIHYVQKGIGMGIRFHDLGDQVRRRIESFVEQVLSRRPPPGALYARKSSRVAIEVPVRVRATHPSGIDVDERTSIISLSKHGASLVTTNPLGVGMKLFIETQSGLEFKSSVVWVGDGSGRGLGQVGVQCRGLAQALGFQFP